jgi:hypothetical protein
MISRVILTAAMFTGAIVCHAQYDMSRVLQPTTQDPVRHFLERRILSSTCDVIGLAADMNADGRDDLFLTSNNYIEGKAGYNWTFYLKRADGNYDTGAIPGVTGSYSRFETTFRRDCFYIGHWDEGTSVALVSFHPGGGGREALSAKYFSLENPHYVALDDDYDQNESPELLEKLRNFAEQATFSTTPSLEIAKTYPCFLYTLPNGLTSSEPDAIFRSVPNGAGFTTTSLTGSEFEDVPGTTTLRFP